LLASTLAVWAGRPAAADDTGFGRVGAMVTAVAGLVTIVLGVVGSYLPARASAVVRWSIALPLTAAAAAVATMGLANLLSPRHTVEFVQGLVLVASAVSMLVVATECARRRPSTTPTSNTAGLA
jgi:uncharacterized membrane protein YfcA